MGRPAKPPRAWWDDSRGEWVILHRDKKVRLGLPKAEEAKAVLAAAEYLVNLSKKASAEPETGRDVTAVSCAEVLNRYLGRRLEIDGVPALKPVARPEELKQRIRKLNAFWGPRPVSAVNSATCEAFTEFVKSDSYSRRCLGDFQAALTEARKADLFRTVIQVSMPPAPEPREDSLSVEEAVALVLVCWRHRDTQQRRVGGHFEMVDGRKKLVGGTLTTILGAKRPWWHVGKFIVTAIATCSRSSRIFEASYAPELGRPWMDTANGVLYRKSPGAKKQMSNKRSPSVDVAERLVAALRRWSSDRVVDGRQLPGDRYVVQWQGQAADPKGAFTQAVIEARRLYPTLFLREDGTTPKQVIRHTLRHTGVTWLAETPGVNVEDICSYAGMTRAMFDRVYGHAHKARSKNIVAAQAKKTGKGKGKVRWLIVPKARKADAEVDFDAEDEDDVDE